MIKKYSIITMFALFAAGSLINPISSSAAAFGNDLATAGQLVTLTVDTNFSFQPSPQVIVSGNSDGQAFTVAAAHSGSFTKSNGSSYMMHSGTSGLFSQNLLAVTDSKVPTLPALTDTVEDGKMGSWDLVEGAAKE